VRRSGAREGRRGDGRKMGGDGGGTLLKGGGGRSGGASKSQATRGGRNGEERVARGWWKMAQATRIGPRPAGTGGGVAV
jgi:hypothetical protein